MRPLILKENALTALGLTDSAPREAPMNGPGIGSWPARRARMNPATVALATDDESLTYAELAARVEATAAAPARAGRRGRRAGRLPRAQQHRHLGLLLRHRRLGGVFVSLNTRLAAPEIGYMLARQRQPCCSCTAPECAEPGARRRPPARTA